MGLGGEISSLHNTSKANLDVDTTEHEMTRTSATSLIQNDQRKIIVGLTRKKGKLQ